jgi:hypothetical protein
MAVAENPDLFIVPLLPGIARREPCPAIKPPRFGHYPPDHNRGAASLL